MIELQSLGLEKHLGNHQGGYEGALHRRPCDHRLTISITVVLAANHTALCNGCGMCSLIDYHTVISFVGRLAAAFYSGSGGRICRLRVVKKSQS